MDNVSQFYNSLFAIEFTVLSILLAGIFIFLQIIYQDRLFNFIKKVPRVKLLCLTVLCLVSISISAAGSLLSAFPHHDFVPYYDFKSQEIISNAWYGLVALLLFLISSIVAIWFTIREILALRPTGLIERVTEQIQGINLRKYLIAKYGLPEPFSFEFPIELIKDKKKLEYSTENEEKQYLCDLKLYKELTTDITDDGDPLEPIAELAIKAIRDKDISILDRCLKALRSVLRKDIYIPDRLTSDWNPNSILHESLVEHLLKWVSFFADECRNEASSRLLKDIYNFSGDVIIYSANRGENVAARKVLSYWKLEADKAINNDTETFRHLIVLQKELGISIFADQNDRNKMDTLNEVFRCIGWLGERLLEKEGFEVEPLMHDVDYVTSCDTVMNSLTDFEDSYRERVPRAYPLIFFDAVQVVFRGLIKELKRNSNEVTRSKISDYIFNCMYAFSSFAEAAIDASNGRGASLATYRLNQAYDELNKCSNGSDIEKVTNNAIELMIGVAFKAAGKGKEAISCEFLSEGIEEHVLRILSEIPGDKDKIIDTCVFNNFIRFDMNENYAAIKSFMKKLGTARGTNFGLRIES